MRTDDVELPPLYVSSSGSDDMGAVLDDLGLEYDPLNSVDVREINDGVVMLNCDGGWESEIELPALRKFLERGGAAIASDHASSAVKTFTDATFSNKVLPTRVTAEVVDDELVDLLGQQSLKLTFNMPLWHKPKRLPEGSRPLLESEGSLFSSGRSVLAYQFSIGNGSMVYTSFHNHAQASDVEEALLQLLLMVPIAESTGTTVTETYTTVIRDSGMEQSSSAGTTIQSSTTGSSREVTNSDSITVRFEGIGRADGSLERRISPDDAIRLGRDDFKGFRSSEELGYVSGEHIELWIDSDTVRMADCDSTNGTTLDDEDISDGQPRTVNPGDEISLAGGRLRLRIYYDRLPS